MGDAGGDDALLIFAVASTAILFRRSGRAGVVAAAPAPAILEEAGGLVDSESGSKDVGLEGDRLRPIWRNWNSGRGLDGEGVSVAIVVGSITLCGGRGGRRNPELVFTKSVQGRHPLSRSAWLYIEEFEPNRNEQSRSQLDPRNLNLA